jgi:diguanylate cyclase (GGDEF)-like protein
VAPWPLSTKHCPDIPDNATLLIDVDNLKMINDVRGHVAGDAVIARTAETIRESIREGDECARLGGDEFIIFAPDCDLEGAKEIARQIVEKLSKHGMPLAGVKFTVSIGIALHEDADADFAKVYHDADEALYQARAAGKNRIGLFTPSHARTWRKPPTARRDSADRLGNPAPRVDRRLCRPTGLAPAGSYIPGCCAPVP